MLRTPIDFEKCDWEVEMAGVFQATRLCAVLSAVALFFAAVASPSYAETGRVRLKVTSVGFIVGIGGGSGTLTFRGRAYPPAISGVPPGPRGGPGRGPG